MAEYVELVSSKLQYALDWLLEHEKDWEKRLNLKVPEKLRLDFMEQLPFILASCVIWAASMRIYNDQKNPYLVSTVHAAMISGMALFNLYLGADNHMEEYVFALTTGYFLADYFTYCLRREFAIFGVHHLITVMAIYRTINGVNWNTTLFASKCILMEISTPFLNHYKLTRSTLAGALFVVSFFAVRVVWLAYLAITGWQVSINNLEYITIIAFTALNYYWFAEILLKLRNSSQKLDDKIEAVQTAQKLQALGQGDVLENLGENLAVEDDKEESDKKNE